MNKYVFLDRDGVLIKDLGYVNKVEDIEFIEGSIEALKKLQKKFSLIIVTNQSGIGRGYYSLEDFKKVQKKVMEHLDKNEVTIKDVFFCHHAPEENCSCRKPGTGMVKNIKDIDKSSSFMIGDKTSDVQFGKNLGIKTILVRTGKSGTDKLYNIKPDFVAENLMNACEIILREKK